MRFFAIVTQSIWYLAGYYYLNGHKHRNRNQATQSQNMCVYMCRYILTVRFAVSHVCCSRPLKDNPSILVQYLRRKIVLGLWVHSQEAAVSRILIQQSDWTYGIYMFMYVKLVNIDKHV